MAEKVGIHLTQIRRYEASEREPQDELRLKFEAVKQMTADEQKSVKDILDAMILKHQAKQLIG